MALQGKNKLQSLSVTYFIPLICRLPVANRAILA